jgi:hypothetical protein
MSKILSYRFPFENGLKWGIALSPLLYNFALEYATRKIKEKKEELGAEWYTSSLVCADVNLLVDNINIIKIQNLY